MIWLKKVMKLALLVPSVYMSRTAYPDMIFAPRELAINLADGLVTKGHEVTVFAAEGTVTKAELVTGDERLITGEVAEEKVRPLGGERFKWASFYSAKWQYEMDLTDRCYKMAREGKFDVVHSYHDLLGHYFDDALGIPTVYTLHDPLPTVKTDLRYILYEKFAGHNFVSISDAFRETSDLRLNFVDTVYHGVRTDEFPFTEKSSDYLVFMGRLVPEKGLHDAISAAIATNVMLQIGTNFPDEGHESVYFTKQIKPYLTHPKIGEPGMVDGADKLILYKKAKALLFPIHWEEAFGMVMIEAMACGVPVIAYNRGSVAEVIVDGVTGFIVDPPVADTPALPERVKKSLGSHIIKRRGVEGLVEAVNRIGDINRSACRQSVAEKFSVATMVEGYEGVYGKVIER